MIAMDEPNTSSKKNVSKEHDNDDDNNNNKHNPHVVSSDDDDEGDDDGDAKLRSIHFLHSKRESSGGGGEDEGDGPEGGGVDAASMRYDEMASFLTRSQRSLDMPDPEPTEEELADRRVQVKDEPEAVYEEPEPLSESESKAYYMGEEDFRRVDVDVELTTMRWEKAQKNKGTKFDAKENPTRGLEEMMDKKKVRSTLRKNHRQAVLEETVRQKMAASGKPLDWEKIRAAAEPYSKEAAQIAYDIALEDAGEKSGKSRTGDGGKKKKKKGGLFGLFKKK